MICIHMGLMKTGSTFFQSRVFPQLKEVTYVHGIESFYGGRFFSFGPMRPVIVSNEGMTGSWYKDEECGKDYFERFQSAVENVLTLFNRPKVIVVFREPASFIRSSYKQFLHENGTKTWEQFFPFPELSTTYLDQFKFSKFIEYAQSRFEPDQLLLLDYNELKTNPADFLDRVLRFSLDEQTYAANSELKLDKLKKSNAAVSQEHERYLILSNKLNAQFKKAFGLLTCAH